MSYKWLNDFGENDRTLSKSQLLEKDYTTYCNLKKKNGKTKNTSNRTKS